MHLNDANDDLGTAKKPFRVAACLAVNERLPLLELTINRLYKNNDCYKVICAGDKTTDKQLCESLGAVWVQHPNKPLGAKWNAAFVKAKEFNPDAVLYVGSSDWLSDNWIHEMEPHVNERGFVGTSGCHFFHFDTKIHGCFWPGYSYTKFHKDRSDETIGIGRMISAKVMDLLNWKPFYDTYDNSLDRSMKERCKKVGYDDFMVTADVSALSISTNLWKNKHNFKHHYHGENMKSIKVEDPTKFLSNYFYQGLELSKRVIQQQKHKIEQPL